MTYDLQTAIAVFAFPVNNLGADLKSNAKLTYDFPEFPQTLSGMLSGAT